MTCSERVPTNIKLTYKNNNDYSLQLTRWFLMPIAVWPRVCTSTIEKFSLQAHIIACSLLITIIMVPGLLYILLEEKDNQIKLSAVGPLSHWIMGMMNYCLLLTRTDDIRECVRHMEMDWKLVRRTDDQEVMLRYAKIGRFIAGFCAVFMQSGTLLFVVAKAMTTITIIVGNVTTSMHPLNCPIYTKFIDTRFSPANEIMLAIELLSCFIVNSITVGACSLAAVFAMHAYGQLDMLFSWLNNLVEHKNKKKEYADQKLATIVKHHLRVLRKPRWISYTFQFYIAHGKYYAKYLPRGIGGMYTKYVFTCILLYYGMLKIRKNWNIFDAGKLILLVIIYISITFNIFVFCYIGETLTEQCKHVGEKAYMINWYELPHETALGLVLIIARSNNVIRLTAGKLFQLSIVTFGDIVKTSVVYLNMLRTMSPSA